MSDDLLARLESATGPDRELDAAIALAVGYTTQPDGYGEGDDWFNPQGKPEPRVRGFGARPPAFTADVNAALSLVPPDCWQEIKGPRKYLNIPSPVPNLWSAYIAKWNHEGDVMGWGATPALAICIAALRARKEEK